MQPIHCKIHRHTEHDVRCEHTYHTLSYGHCMLHPDARKLLLLHPAASKQAASCRPGQGARHTARTPSVSPAMLQELSAVRFGRTISL